MLNSIHGAFKAILRTSDNCGPFLDKTTTNHETITGLLDSNRIECDIEKILPLFHSLQKDFSVDSGLLQSFQHIIQWTTNLSLHLMASIPEYKQMRRGPGFDLFTNHSVLSTLRELLLVIRIWSGVSDGCQPAFTKAADSFDVVGKLFALVTKQRETPGDEELNDDCLRLPSQVMIPPLNLTIKARGVSPSVVSFHRQPLNFEFGIEPDFEVTNINEAVFIEGAMSTNQLMDCVRLMYLGKNPYSVKQSTRSTAVTFCGSSGAGSANPPTPSRSEERR